ncbi:hypothetical protein [Paenarthrobacter sp. NPDC058040]|uniref:hypothetical protein n=1 Tax=unclassified Paenarthrobacter TaxID=2634190 RepID=UPI0036D8B34B
MNTYRDNWIQAVNGDFNVSTRACAVAAAVGRSMGIGRIATRNWQKLNSLLGRERRDDVVLDGIAELQSAGYLERYFGNDYRYSAGWRLTLPGEVG